MLALLSLVLRSGPAKPTDSIDRMKCLRFMTASVRDSATARYPALFRALGNNRQSAGLPPHSPCAPALQSWQGAIGHVKRRSPVFCGVNSMATGRLRRACRRAGLRKIGWHTPRHSFASHLAMRCIPLNAIQDLMGHSTIELTMRYAI